MMCKACGQIPEENYENCLECARVYDDNLAYLAYEYAQKAHDDLDEDGKNA